MIRLRISSEAEATRSVLEASRVARELGFTEQDAKTVATAVSELARNILKYAGEGEIRIEGVELDRKVGLRVHASDRGPGIEQDKRDSVFAPYFTTRRDGTGLGLAIVQRIAFAHHWRATFRPRPGGGAIFCLEGVHAGNQDNSRGG